MRCNDYNEQLSAYLDGALSEEEAHALTTHLETCENCKETLAALQVIQKELQSIDGIQVPASFHDHMMAKVREESSQVPNETPKAKQIAFKKIRHLWPVAAAAVLVLVINQNTPKQTMPLHETQGNSSYMAIEEAPTPVQAEENIGVMEMKKMPATLSATPTMDRGASEVVWSIQVEDTELFGDEMMEWLEVQGCNVEYLEADMTYGVNFPNEETKAAFLTWATETHNVTVSGEVGTPQLSIKIIMMK
ncbi:MAG: anti-sigma factor family protein [Cellulosilyticaceae bacterium]